MIKDQGLSFETQLKIEFLPPNNGSNKCLEKSLLADVLLGSEYAAGSLDVPCKMAQQWFYFAIFIS